MLRFAIGTREDDADTLREIVDADEDKIESPYTDATRFERDAKRCAELLDDAFQIFRIADGLGKTQLCARHLGRNERDEGLLSRSERLVEAQERVATEP